MSNQDLSKLTEKEWKDLICERLKVKLGMSVQEAQTKMAKIYDHYKRLNVFPKNLSTLEVSLKALVSVTSSEDAKKSSIPTFTPFNR